MSPFFQKVEEIVSVVGFFEENEPATVARALRAVVAASEPRLGYLGTQALLGLAAGGVLAFFLLRTLGSEKTPRPYRLTFWFFWLVVAPIACGGLFTLNLGLTAAPLVALVMIALYGYFIADPRDARERKRRRAEEAERERREEELRKVRWAREQVLIAFDRSPVPYGISPEARQTLLSSSLSAEGILRELQRIVHEAPWRRGPGVDLGFNLFAPLAGVPPARFQIRLPEKLRSHHLYVIGKTGSGKTTLLQNMIAQDLAAGAGLAAIAPEAELLTEQILPFVPEGRTADVIYFNPADTERPIPFNPLHLDEGEDIDRRVDENLTIFRRLMGETPPRMEELLRQTFYALMERSGATLLDVDRLLDREDPSFRKEIISTTRDEDTARFFEDVYPRFPRDAQLPITNRIGRLVRSKKTRALLCQPEGSLDIRKAMDSGKILLFNVSDGLLGETTSRLLGQLLISKLQIAAMSRADIPARERRRFYVYIDEFQAFTGVAAKSYEVLLSRARKYELGLVLAHQQTSQLPLELLREVIGNVDSMVSFSISHADAAKLANEFGTDWEPEHFTKLPIGYARAKIGTASFSMQTFPPLPSPDHERARRIIEHSREHYGATPPRLAERLRVVGSSDEPDEPEDFLE